MKNRKDKNGKIILSRKRYERLEILFMLPLILFVLLFSGSLVTLFILDVIDMENNKLFNIIGIVSILTLLGCILLSILDLPKRLYEKYVQEEENTYAYLEQLGYEGEPLEAAGKFLSEFY